MFSLYRELISVSVIQYQSIQCVPQPCDVEIWQREARSACMGLKFNVTRAEHKRGEKSSEQY